MSNGATNFYSWAIATTSRHTSRHMSSFPRYRWIFRSRNNSSLSHFKCLKTIHSYMTVNKHTLWIFITNHIGTQALYNNISPVYKSCQGQYNQLKVQKRCKKGSEHWNLKLFLHLNQGVDLNQKFKLTHQTLICCALKPGP